MARNWTPEQRQKQSADIHKQRPWDRSTGPRGAAGKKIASQNAYVHGGRSADLNELRRLLRAQKAFVKAFAAALES